jgi:outer membrane protein TolC
MGCVCGNPPFVVQLPGPDICPQSTLTTRRWHQEVRFMKLHCSRLALLMAFCVQSLVPQTYLFSQTGSEMPAEGSRSRKGVSGFFAGFVDRYRDQPIQSWNLENTPRIDALIRDGKIELTLSDALALALENNLDIAVQRFVPSYSQTDLLRSQSGQSPRGFTGASIPGGLTSGALGAGISGTGAGSGVGSAGGITGGGGAVQVGAAGNFDPSFNLNFSWDRVTSPLNTIQVSGIPTVIGQTSAFTASYAQLFGLGTSYSLTLNGQRQSSTQRNLIFNPATVSRFAFGINQPLLNGFGRLTNERYIWVARNNTKVSEQVFRLQVINAVVAVENAYWDLAALQESVRVAEQSLGVSRQLHRDNQMRVEIGTMSPLDVTSAESEVAARMRDLTLAQTNVQLQEAALKNMLVKRVSPELDAARIVIKDAMPVPADADIPDLQTTLAAALEGRPELAQSQVGLENQDIAVRFTDAALKPAFSVFGFYAGSGLEGNSTTDTALKGGLTDSFGQSFKAEYPEYAGGFSMSIPLRNRTAQADSLRAQLEMNQLRVTQQRLRNTVSLEVRKAIIGLIQGKAQVEAARQASRLAREIWEGEKEKLLAGVSTSYQVILRERDYTAAQQAEVSSVVGYAKALVELDRARGTTLERNSIEYSDALKGTVSNPPAPFSLRNSNRGAK